MTGDNGYPRNLLLYIAATAGGLAAVLFTATVLWVIHVRNEQAAKITQQAALIKQQAQNIKEQADKLCASNVTNRRALRKVIIISKQFSLSSPVRTFQERHRIADFYAAVLKPIPPLKCVNGEPMIVRPQPSKETP